MQLTKRITKSAFVTGGIVVAALIAEFVILEGTIGVSLPSDRYSAVSTLEISSKRTGLHFITRNKRFTVVDFLTAGGSRTEPLVLSESFFADWDYGAKGPPDSTVTVAAIDGKNTRWKFREPGQRGNIATDDLYMVTKFGCCGSPSTYTYFSLADGRKFLTRNAELSRDELEALGRLAVK
jgi:hypothetical protein